MIKNNDDISNQLTLRIDGNDDMSSKDLINKFTLIFCDIKPDTDKKTFTPKKEFKFLQLILPEFLPFINFIQKIDGSKEVKSTESTTKKTVKDFNNQISDCLSGYYKILDENFWKNNTEDKDLDSFLKNFQFVYKAQLSNFRTLFTDFLEFIAVENQVIKSYMVLITIEKFQNTRKYYSLHLYFRFFAHFIDIAGKESKKYVNKFENHFFIIGKKNVNKDEIKKVKESIYKIINVDILISMFNEYNLMLGNLNMLEFKLEKYFIGWVGFDKKIRNRFCLCKKVDESKNTRIGFNQIVEVFCLELLENLFTELNIE